MNTFPHLIRREFWEHRAFYVVPLVVGVILIVGVITGLVYGSRFGSVQHIVAKLSELNGDERGAVASLFAVGMAMPFALALGMVTFFYLIDSLYADRKDGSILFWKSLPVSDTAVVLSKFATAMIVLPALSFAALLVTLLLNGIVATASIWAGGGGAWELLWGPAPLASMMTVILYTLLVQSLWYAPLAAWLLLASAWARSVPLMWAFAPPLAVMLLEKIVLDTHRFSELMADRLGGAFPLAFTQDHPHMVVRGEMTDMPSNMLAVINPTGLLTSPGLWGGLVVAAAFVAGAIFLRRYRDET